MQTDAIIKENMLSENKMENKTNYQCNGELLSNDNSSNGSSVSSLKSRLRNLPVPTLDERLAAFDRRLQWSEWKWRVHQQDDLLEGKVDENDETEYIKKTVPNQAHSELSGLPLNKMSSRTNFKSRIARPNYTISRKTESIYPIRSTQNMIGGPQEPSSNIKFRNIGEKTNSSVEWLKKRLAESLKESQGTCELPLLPNKNLMAIRRTRSLDSRYQPDDSSGSDRTIRDRSIDQQMRNQKQERSSGSKLSDSSSSEVNLPCIKSRSSFDRNLALAACKSRRELLYLTNQFQPTCQPSKTRPMQTEMRIKSLYLRKNSFPQESTSSLESKNAARSSMSTPKNKFKMKNFDFLTPPGFYTDRPKSSNDFSSITRTRSRTFEDRDDASNNSRIEIPPLNIRSLSNSIDSYETYNISSRTEEIRQTKSSGSNSCTCFRTSKTSTESSSWSSTDGKNTELHLTPKLRRSVSKIPVRISPNWKKSSSLSSESKSSSGRSEDSHVSEYESKTMVVVTSSQSLLKPRPSVESNAKSIIYRVSITDENEELGPEKKLQALVPAMLMNISHESDQSLAVKFKTQTEENSENETVSAETKKVQLIEEGLGGKKVNEERLIDRNKDESKDLSAVKIVKAEVSGEKKHVKEHKDEEKDREKKKVEADEESGLKSVETKQESIVRKNNLAFVKSESAIDLQTKREDRINLLPGSVSTSKLSSLRKQRKEGQVRFPFTISLNEGPKTKPDQSKKVNNKSEVTKHPSLIRLANIGSEPNSTEIYNFLYVHPRTKNYECKKKGFFSRLFSWFSNSKTKSNEVVEFKHGRFLNENEVPGRNVVPVCAKPSEENEPDTIRDIFSNNKFGGRGDEWVKQFDSTRELDKSGEKVRLDCAEKKKKELAKTENEYMFFRRNALPYELATKQNDCLCFRWCHV